MAPMEVNPIFTFDPAGSHAVVGAIVPGRRM